MKNGCLLSPQLYSSFINVPALEVDRKGGRGVHLIPGTVELLILLSTHDDILLLDSSEGLRKKSYVLEKKK